MTNRQIIHQPLSKEIRKLVAHHGSSREAVLEVLTDLDREGKLDPGTVDETARALGLPPHQVYGMATFYSMLALEPRGKILRICDGPVCWLKRATTSSRPQTTVQDWSSVVSRPWSVERSSCLGLCDRAPAALVDDEQAGPVDPQDAGRVCQGWRGISIDYTKPRPGEVRAMLAQAEKIDPDSIESALAHGGYSGLKAAFRKKPEEVIAAVEAAGLQGRGGAGFPVGRKWKFVAAAARTPKYMICNAMNPSRSSSRTAS